MLITGIKTFENIHETVTHTLLRTLTSVNVAINTAGFVHVI